MIDSASVLPAQACVDADNYDMTDYIERVVDYYTVDNMLWPMPFNVSNPVLYYNKAAFERPASIPNKPPTTLDEITRRRRRRSSTPRRQSARLRRSSSTRGTRAVDGQGRARST